MYSQMVNCCIALLFFLYLHYRCYSENVRVIFIWVPAHVGVKGNEAADRLAKQAVMDTSIEMTVSYNRYEIKAKIK